MDTAQINSYGLNSTGNSTSTKTNSSKSAMSTTDFLELLAAQMTNQDVMNPMEDTEFISQMAQFTALQATEDLSNISSSQLKETQALSQLTYMQYGAALVGKTVLVATTDEAGQYAQQKGVVDSVSFGSETYTVSVNGKKYNLSSIMEVLAQTSETDAKAAAVV